MLPWQPSHFLATPARPDGDAVVLVVVWGHPELWGNRRVLWRCYNSEAVLGKTGSPGLLSTERETFMRKLQVVNMEMAWVLETHIKYTNLLVFSHIKHMFLHGNRWKIVFKAIEFSIIYYELLVTCGKSFPFPKRHHPFTYRDGTARTFENLFLMRLPLLLLLEMAGTCYIITEGGKTRTFQHYLQQKTFQPF